MAALSGSAGARWGVGLAFLVFSRGVTVHRCGFGLCPHPKQGALEAVFDASSTSSSSLATSRIHGIEGGSSVVPSVIPPPMPSASSRYPSAASPAFYGAGSSPTLSDPLHQPPISTGTMQGFGYDPDGTLLLCVCAVAVGCGW